MRSTLFIFLWATYAQLGFSQKVNLQLSDEQDRDRKTYFEYHLHSDATGHYLLSKRHEIWMSGFEMSTQAYLPIIQKYDSTLNLVYQKEYPSIDKNEYFQGIQYFKGFFVMATAQEDRKAKSCTFNALPINLDGESSEPITLVKVSGDLCDLNFNMVKSEDSTKMACVILNDTHKRNKSGQLYFAVIDSDMKKLWEKKVEMVESQSRVDLIQYKVSNSGKLYYLTKEYAGNRPNVSKSKPEKGKQVAFKYNINVLVGDDSIPRKLSINLSNSFIADVNLNLDSEENLVLIGTFGEEKSMGVDGIFSMKLDKDGQILYSDKKLFTSNQLEILKGKKRASSWERDSDAPLDFDCLFAKKSGDLCSAVERNYRVENSTRNQSGFINISYVYYSEDILALELNQNGTIKDLALIPKKQSQNNTPNGIGHVTVANDNGTYYFYNEDVSNLKKPIFERKNWINNSRKYVMVMTFKDSETGNLVRKEIMNRNTNSMCFDPGTAKQISPNQLFFVTRKLKLFSPGDFKLGLVTIE